MIEMGFELDLKTEAGRVYVLIINGREHNVYVESIGQHYLFGRVALNKVAMLIDRPGRGGVVAKVVLPQDEKTAIGPGDDLLHSAPCVVPSDKLNIRIKLEDISVVEDPWRPMLSNDVFNEDGNVNPSKLCEIMQDFKEYYVEGKGFVGSPALWATGVRSIKPNSPLKVVQLEDSSDDE